MKVEMLGAGVFTIEEFLSGEECGQYISISESVGYEIATIESNNVPEINTEIRNNDRVIFDSPETASFMYERARPIMPEIVDGW